MVKQATELRYAVRSRVLFKHFGQLCLVLAVLTMVPLVMSLIFGERHFTLRYAVVVCGLGDLGWGTAGSKAALRFPWKPLKSCGNGDPIDEREDDEESGNDQGVINGTS